MDNQRKDANYEDFREVFLWAVKMQGDSWLDWTNRRKEVKHP